MIFPILMMASIPTLSVPLHTHGWQEVGSQPAINDSTITMKFWLAPASIASVPDKPWSFKATVTIEAVQQDGTQQALQTIGQLIDCKAFTWQNEWGAFSAEGQAFVSYFQPDQRGQPEIPEAGSGMYAVIKRVCASYQSDRP